MTVLAEFLGDFTVSLKYFGGFTVFGSPLRPPHLATVTSGLNCPSRANFFLSWIDSSLIDELQPQQSRYSS